MIDDWSEKKENCRLLFCVNTQYITGFGCRGCILVFILLNAKLVSDHVKQNIGFSIIVKDNVNEAEIKKMQKILDTKPFVSSSVFISKVEAAREFKEELGEDFEGVLGYNPLLPSVEIKLNPVYANNDSLTVIEKSLLKTNWCRRCLIRSLWCI